MRRSPARRHPPRLVVKILGVSFAVIVAVLATVFLLLSWQTRARLTQTIVESVEASQTRFAELETARQRERRLQVSTLVENPTLKAAVDVYHAERAFGTPTEGLLSTVHNELAKLQQVFDLPALAVADLRSTVLASAGPLSADWPVGSTAHLPSAVGAGAWDGVLSAPAPGREARLYRATVVPLTLGQDVIGDVILATPIDDAYARRLAADAGTDVVVYLDGDDIASSLPAASRALLTGAVMPDVGTVLLGPDEFVIRRLSSFDGVQVYALGSVSAPIAAATAQAAWAFLAVGAGALLLAAAASWYLARTIADPIDDLRRTLAEMADARDFERPLPQTGTSLELDALAGTFNQLRAAVAAAEAESEATYLGVIGTLAAALDARDPYTAGHSQRVADLSVAIARQIGLPDDQVGILRLGALLHDIGKIGINDAILRKPGTLTDDEFEQIKRHTVLGAQILKPLHFLADHLAIVELHHERPDGRGYPRGLAGDDIPLLARIVHVADAFDAMTSARSYRPGRPPAEAMAELWQHAGTGFDLRIVQVMAMMPGDLLARPPVTQPAPETSVGGAILPFRRRAAAPSRQTAG